METLLFAALQWLHTEGNRIVNESNETVILRGVNLERREYIYKSSPGINYETKAIPIVAGNPPNGWGANFILIAFASGPVNRGDQQYLGFLDEIVQKAKENGAYTLLAYRYKEPNGDQPAMPDQDAQDALATLALRYKSEPAVLYGLQVEPSRVSWAELKPRFISMIDAIRANNSRALIAVPGTQWSRYVHHQVENPIDRENLIFKSHPYDSWDTIQKEYRFDEMLNAGYPLLLGEFGAGSQMSLGNVENLLEYANTKGISWAAWMFSDEACPCLLADRTTFEPTPYGALIKTFLTPISPPVIPPSPPPLIPPRAPPLPPPLPVTPPPQETAIYPVIRPGATSNDGASSVVLTLITIFLLALALFLLIKKTRP
ncbi:MAG: cellulase family glycosylhydrolase [Candidatus Wildermuthbacteria bacterium]|nr:cellulase family glycosylhydrolase [Candidatus Wildermuthbacteria bacterium]